MLDYNKALDVPMFGCCADILDWDLALDCGLALKVLMLGLELAQGALMPCHRAVLHGCEAALILCRELMEKV